MSINISVIDSILEAVSNPKSPNMAIVTIPSAVYYGRPHLFRGTDADNTRYLDDVDEIVSTVGKLISAKYNETAIEGNDGCFMLKDVFMITANATMRLPFVVFYSQVSSISMKTTILAIKHPPSAALCGCFGHI